MNIMQRVSLTLIGFLAIPFSLNAAEVQLKDIKFRPDGIPSFILDKDRDEPSAYGDVIAEFVFDINDEASVDFPAGELIIGDDDGLFSLVTLTRYFQESIKLQRQMNVPFSQASEYLENAKNMEIQRWDIFYPILVNAIACLSTRFQGEYTKLYSSQDINIFKAQAADFLAKTSLSQPCTYGFFFDHFGQWLEDHIYSWKNNDQLDIEGSYTYKRKGKWVTNLLFAFKDLCWFNYSLVNLNTHYRPVVPSSEKEINVSFKVDGSIYDRLEGKMTGLINYILYSSTGYARNFPDHKYTAPFLG